MIDGLVQFRDSNYYTDKQGNVYRHYPEKIKVYFTTQGYEFRKKFPERLKPVKPFNGGRFSQSRNTYCLDLLVASITVGFALIFYQLLQANVPEASRRLHQRPLEPVLRSRNQDRVQEVRLGRLQHHGLNFVVVVAFDVLCSFFKL